MGISGKEQIYIQVTPGAAARALVTGLLYLYSSVPATWYVTVVPAYQWRTALNRLHHWQVRSQHVNGQFMDEPKNHCRCSVLWSKRGTIVELVKLEA